MQNPGVAALVLDTEEPFLIKSLTRLLPFSKVWNDSRDEYNYQLNLAKFAQNQELARKLVNTGDQSLFEATRDTHFGAGLPLSQAQTIGKDSPGDNVHGKNFGISETTHPRKQHSPSRSCDY